MLELESSAQSILSWTCCPSLGQVPHEPQDCQALLAEIGVLGRGATDHGRMDAEVGQPATASDPPGPVAPAPLDDGREITAAMIKAAVKHEKPVVLSADQASPHIRGRCYTLVRVVLEAVYEEGSVRGGDEIVEARSAAEGVAALRVAARSAAAEVSVAGEEVGEAGERFDTRPRWGLDRRRRRS